MAQEVTLDFTTNGWNLPEGSSNKLKESKSFTNGGYTIQLAAADGYYFNTSGYLMLGKSGSTLTLPAFSFDVEKIEVVGREGASGSVKQNLFVGETAISTETTGATSNNIYEIAAEYQAAGNVYVLKVNSAHNTQITKILIYKKGGGGTTVTVPAPKINGTTPFTESTEVSISGPDGGSVKYTTDGSDPANGTTYTAPFTITETTTVKAIGYDEDGNASEVAEKTFTKQENVTAENIAAFNALAHNTKNVVLTLKDAQVLSAGNNNIVIKDATASTLIYDKNLKFTQGQILNGTITGTRQDYNGFTEISSVSANTITATEGTITPKTATPEEVIAAGYFANLYKMEKVECKLEEDRYYITVGDNKIQVYDNHKLGFSITADGTFNVTGVLGAYKGVPYQFWLTEAPEATQTITYPEAANIAAVKELESGKTVKLTLKDAVVNYVNGTADTFIEDATGAIDFYNMGSDFTYTAGQVLNGTVIVQYKPYNNMPEVVAVKGVTVADDITVTDGAAPAPKEMSIADAAKIENACKLVTIKNITLVQELVQEEKNYYADADKTLQVFDKYKVGYTPNTESAMDYTGILIPFKEQFQICPTVEPTASQGGGDTPAKPEMIAFGEEDVAAVGEVKSEFAKGDFKLTVVDTGDKEGKKKISIDANNCNFGTAESYQKFTHRLKTGGKSSSSNSLTLTIPSDGTLKVYVRSASSSAVDRNLVLTQNETELYNEIVKDADVVEVTFEGDEKATKIYPVITVAVKAGELAVGYPTGALNFYGIEFIAGASGVNAVIVEKAKNNIRYNLAGQRVDESYKGVVIMNGKKFVVK